MTDNWKTRLLPGFLGAAMCAMWAGDAVNWARQRRVATTTNDEPRPLTKPAVAEQGAIPNRPPNKRGARRHPDWTCARPAIYDAICQVESGGDNYAVGDGGRSKGPMQISRAYWQDACEYGGLDWSYDKYVWNRARCEYVMYLYWQRYGAETQEEKARIHNGGPDGAQQDCTLDYWNKVKQRLENNNENK